jgi:RNase P subunit RPR2
MATNTCVACDCPLEPSSIIKVTIGGRTVEVCCEECAVKLREASGAKRKQDE